MTRAWIVAVVPVLAAALVAADETTHRGGAATDPAKVVGPEKCGECHKNELEAWKAMHHATTFLEMHRKDRAKEIVEAVGGKRIKVNEHCLTCHYTEGTKAGRTAAMWGVTCESCHGGAAAWVDGHGSYGPKGTTREMESPEHRKERLRAAEAAGMIRPSNIYAAAANCFQCHTVPDEELVDKGGHKPRSEFELVAWSQGEMRHNYQHSADQKNRPASPEHKRLLYVLGRGLDLEYSLRAAARATSAGPYADAASAAVAAAIAKLKEIQSAQPVPEVAAMLKAAEGVAVKPGAGAALTGAADAVGAAGRKLAQAHDGSQLAAVDKLLPPASSYRGTARP